MTSYTLGKLLLVCLIVSQGASTGPDLTVSPSPTSQATPSSSTGAASTSNHLVLPTLSPLPRTHTCFSGPDIERADGRVTVTNRTYLDISEPVNCSGVITSWYYCHIVIGFRDKSSGLWPCVWRRSNDSNGYEIIACNKFTIIPGDGEEIRCHEYVPSNPSDFIRVEEGDYIGFYIPDSGLFLAFSDSNYDEHHYQLERNVTGFSNFIGDSELRNASSESGRVLLSAEIDSDWVYPSVIVSHVSPTPTPTPPPVTAPPTSKPVAAPVLPLAVSLVIAVGVTVVMTITVIALIAYLNCKHRCFSGYNRFQSGINHDMDYNDMYKFRSANHVVVGNKRTFVSLSENPAYDSISPNQSHEERHQEATEDVARSVGRRQMEHTYESLSNFHIHATNVTK